MFGFKSKGKRNYPLIIGAAGAAAILYLFVATRIVKAPPVKPAAAHATPTGGGAGIGPGIDSSIAGVAGGTGNFNYPSGLRGIPGGYGVSGAYAARSYDSFPYSARLAVA